MQMNLSLKLHEIKFKSNELYYNWHSYLDVNSENLMKRILHCIPLEGLICLMAS
jgi:hypothetical protein